MVPKIPGIDPLTYAKKMEEAGAGEIFLNVIDRDGTYKGYDLDLIKKISEPLNILSSLAVVLQRSMICMKPCNKVLRQWPQEVCSFFRDRTGRY